MILTWTVPTTQQRATLDALNRASGAIYTRVMQLHWAIYHHTGLWLSSALAEKLDDALNIHKPKLLQPPGPPRPVTQLPHQQPANQKPRLCPLHSHSIDAAQQGFYKALKTAHTLRKTYSDARYPYKRKWFRSTLFKSSAITFEQPMTEHVVGEYTSLVRLSCANRRYLYVPLPTPLLQQPSLCLKEARLVYNRDAHHYEWHLVVDDGMEVSWLSEGSVMGIDLGEIHPAVLATQQQGILVSCRELRSTVQHRNKVLASFSQKMARCMKYSNHWHQLKSAKIQWREYFKRKVRDLEHKISRVVVNEAVALGVKTIALGDVRNIGVGKRLNNKSQQKISQWSHGRLRSYITYKAARCGIEVVLVSEAYTTQTCPKCKKRHKPKGREYRCRNKKCGFVGHRDLVGASNIVAKQDTGKCGGVYPQQWRVLHPFDCRKKKSKQVSGVQASSAPCERSHVAWEQLSLFRSSTQEATGL